MINVTKTYLPDREKFKQYVDRIFDSGWITNNGELVKILQQKLSDYLKVKHIHLVSNGTTSLQIAYKALGLTGEVITTPFSFVATTSSLVWEGLTPVFVDIDELTYCINTDKIEEKITERTSAIVATHVFGNTCNIEEIERIARKYNLRVIYDAAHSFGVKYKGRSVYSYGDISIASFHSTKVFHTIEGGALIMNDDTVYEKVKNMSNFGITGPEQIIGLGINAKINEFEAAMGLCLLDEIDENIRRRERVYSLYRDTFVEEPRIKLQEWNADGSYNYGYFPLVFENEEILLKVISALNEKGINPRRYFYPSLDRLSYIDSDYMKVSNSIAERIICLPLYETLSFRDQMNIIQTIQEALD
ncbi:DegT/DnrJ/EryC1/StrS family aminotransferase [Paenibacillus agri]|uniref:DegT/DnrJ/EryC1/StrS family aminotransferase n=1 Tax=Paenibacillus agri TaxID=2744309 RepID=A0A850EIP0_9BACL|nr:DegT/DnrJ/EryC1/StrS family aminotransferase [Paenibacillus agri]NUU60935.1 DegT/DnrJ/EryC1/StrS family aminotransferase [Paenibacillus agri]